MPAICRHGYQVGRLGRFENGLDHWALTSNAAELGMHDIAVKRKGFLFMGSDKGGSSGVIAKTLAETSQGRSAGSFLVVTLLTTSLRFISIGLSFLPRSLDHNADTE